MSSQFELEFGDSAETSRRTIIHFDVDAFGVAVVRVLEPELRGRAVAVGVEAGGRGLVACSSYEARAAGVWSGMPLGMARRRGAAATGGGLVVVTPEREAEEGASRALFELLRSVAPVAELATMDDVFLDVTGCDALFGGNMLRWAMGVAGRVREETGLPVSFGIGSNKLVAKVATRLAKPGHGLLVRRGEEAEFLCGAPVRVLPGVGDVTRERLKEYGITRVGEMASLGAERLGLLFGDAAGADLARRAAGIDFEPVRETRVERRIGHGHVFEEDTTDPELLRGAAALLAQRLAWDFRRAGARVSRGELTVTFADGAVAERAVRLDYPSRCDGDVIGAVCAALTGALGRKRVRVRKVHLSAPAPEGVVPSVRVGAERNAELRALSRELRSEAGEGDDWVKTGPARIREDGEEGKGWEEIGESCTAIDDLAEWDWLAEGPTAGSDDQDFKNLNASAIDVFQERAQKKAGGLYAAIDEVRAKHGFASLVSAAGISALDVWRRNSLPGRRTKRSAPPSGAAEGDDALIKSQSPLRSPFSGVARS